MSAPSSSSAKGDTSVSQRGLPYYLPPGNYNPPERCATCKARIIFGPVVGGFKWHHLSAPVDYHEVKMPRRWFDTFTGLWETGTWSPFGHNRNPLQ